MKKIFLALMMASMTAAPFLAFAQSGAAANAASDDLDALFADPSSAVIAEAAVVDNPESAVFGGNAFSWTGEFSSDIGISGGYKELAPSMEELKNPTERLSVGIGAKLSFDARPDKNYRVFGKFTTDYPFMTRFTASDPQGAEAAYSLNNIKLFELFSDFNYKEKVFFRFGKQTAGWGLSRFYQIADPLTVGVKDPSNPSADLEGPIALKVAFPFGLNNLYFYSAVKESYLPSNVGKASIRDVGVGMKGDFLIPLPANKYVGNADFTVGAYGQRNLSPKAIAGLSTSVGNFQIFTDQALSWGLDSYRLTKDVLPGPPGFAIYDVEKPKDGLFYRATAGTMYVNNDWHFTFYGEYMFSSSGSSDRKYLEKWTNRLYAEMAPASLLTPELSFSDLFGYQSRNNSGVSLSWSELFGNDKFGFSALWLQNWVDFSGMAKPTVSFKPFDHVTLETGATVVWGEDRSEWVVKNSDAVTQSPKRLSGFLSVKIGGGKF